MTENWLLAEGEFMSLRTKSEDTVTMSLLLCLRWQWRHLEDHPDPRLGSPPTDECICTVVKLFLNYT